MIDRGSGINGAAARLVAPGDLVSLIAYVQLDDAHAISHRRGFAGNLQA
jgi:aspartate 1-decarboxylase